MRRGFDENIWVRTLERRVLKEPEVSVVITDLRFTNEVEGIHRLGGLVIRVDRPEDQIPPATTPDEDQHESETALDGYSQWDFIVENTGTLRDLQRKIENLVTLALLDDLNLNPQTTL
jgi:hypothetical protein